LRTSWWIFLSCLVGFLLTGPAHGAEFQIHEVWTQRTCEFLETDVPSGRAQSSTHCASTLHIGGEIDRLTAYAVENALASSPPTDFWSVELEIKQTANDSEAAMTIGRLLRAKIPGVEIVSLLGSSSSRSDEYIPNSCDIDSLLIAASAKARNVTKAFIYRFGVAPGEEDRLPKLTAMIRAYLGEMVRILSSMR